MSVETLLMWVVYDHPSDYPDSYVARQVIIGIEGGKPTGRLMEHAEVEPIRSALAQMGLVRINRSEADDPVILETWL